MARVLPPLALRKLRYRLLSGPYGVALGQMAIPGSYSHEIGQIIRRINAKFGEPIRVEDLTATAKNELAIPSALLRR